MTILIILIVLIAGFAFLVSRQPEHFAVSRSMSMTAQPVTIFPLVNNLSQWNGWSPWAKIDPNTKTTFSGPSEGVGACMAWESSNNQVGIGSTTITESLVNQVVHLRLDFLKPMKATNTAEFTFIANGDRTVVTWSMQATNNFIGKIMNLVFNCDKMVGGKFEEGLAAMKSIAEKS